MKPGPPPKDNKRVNITSGVLVNEKRAAGSKACLHPHFAHPLAETIRGTVPFSLRSLLTLSFSHHHTKKVGGMAPFLLGSPKGLAAKPARTHILPIPLTKKGGGMAPFSQGSTEGLAAKLLAPSFCTAPCLKGWGTAPFSLGSAEGLAEKPARALIFASPRQKGWGDGAVR